MAPLPTNGKRPEPEYEAPTRALPDIEEQSLMPDPS